MGSINTVTGLLNKYIRWLCLFTVLMGEVFEYFAFIERRKDREVIKRRDSFCGLGKRQSHCNIFQNMEFVLLIAFECIISVDPIRDLEKAVSR